MLGVVGMLLIVYQTSEARALVFQYHQALQDHKFLDAAELRQRIAMNLPDTGTMKQTELLLLMKDAEMKYRQRLLEDDCCCEEE
jgi:hypothetical protein